jgi:hypothetical protein
MSYQRKAFLAVWIVLAWLWLSFPSSGGDACVDIKAKLPKLPTIYESKNPDVVKALDFIDKMQNPPSCSNLSYVIVDPVWFVAGLASQVRYRIGRS